MPIPNLRLTARRLGDCYADAGLHCIAFSAALFAASCVAQPAPDSKTAEVNQDTKVLDQPVRDAGTPSHEATCEARLSLLQESSDAPGMRLDIWAHIVFEARARNRIYLTRPSQNLSDVAKKLRVSLDEHERPRKRLRKLKKTYQKQKEILRQVLLSDGYVYEEKPRVALGIVKELTLTDLFDEPVIYRENQGKIEPLLRKDNEYHSNDGIVATLVLNDRVAIHKNDLLNGVHLDLDEVMNQTGAIRAQVKRLSTTEAWIDLFFPSGEIRPALVNRKQTRTIIACIGGEPRNLDALISQAKSFKKWRLDLVDAASRMVEERPRFDEPLDEAEDVQEDGDLRLEWYRAYLRRKKVFMFREVEYDVFDRRGNPTPPQVCVDFIFDVWERAKGTWYRKRGQEPGKSHGEIDFLALPDFSRRHISTILTYANGADAPFDRYDISRRDWIPYEKHRRFIKKLRKHARSFLPGDMLVIHGLREEDMEEHFHTVLILEVDPLTGIPTRVADNQGRPRIGTLSNAMRTAPKRAIKYRLRVDFEKLKQITRQYREGSVQER